MVRVPAPSDTEIASVISHVAQKESVNLSPALSGSVVAISKGNTRRALLSFEAAVAKGSNTAENPDWEVCIAKATDQVFRDQTSASLMSVRTMFYELLTHCIPVGVIVQAMLAGLVSRCKNAETAVQIAEAAAFYEHRAVRGSKAILHLEAFAAKTMSILASSK